MSVRSSYLDFWHRVGDRFPDLAGAVPTRDYADNERRLFAEHFARLAPTTSWPGVPVTPSRASR